MRRVLLGKVPAYQFHSLQKFSDQVSHAVFSRSGGTSEGSFASLNVRFGVGDSHVNVAANRAKIAKAMAAETGLSGDRGTGLISADQTHSKNVCVIDEEFLAQRGLEGNELMTGPGAEVPDVDAFITALSEVPIMVQVADCQAIVMFDPEHHVVAAVHAGWKGLQQDISGETIRILKRDFGVHPESLRVGISPSLGPCCAFFSNPEEELPVSFHPFIDKKKRVDLWGYSMKQLEWHGVQKGNIELARVCTQCHPRDDFFSFRGGHGISGRFGTVVALRG